MTKKIDKYTFNAENTYYRVPEHEVLISFNNDDDAYAFNEWWYKRGKEEFEKFFSKEMVQK